MEKTIQEKIAIAMKNAEMSARMEGLELTPQLQNQCLKILNGEKSWQKFVEDVNDKYKNT